MEEPIPPQDRLVIRICADLPPYQARSLLIERVKARDFSDFASASPTPKADLVDALTAFGDAAGGLIDEVIEGAFEDEPTDEDLARLRSFLGEVEAEGYETVELPVNPNTVAGPGLTPVPTLTVPVSEQQRLRAAFAELTRQRAFDYPLAVRLLALGKPAGSAPVLITYDPRDGWFLEVEGVGAWSGDRLCDVVAQALRPT